MTVRFSYGDIEKYGVRRNLALQHVRSIVVDYQYMTVVYMFGNVERYVFDDVENLQFERSNAKWIGKLKR